MQDGFAGLFAAFAPVRVGARKFLEENIIPKTPEEQREILLNSLRERLREIKERIGQGESPQTVSDTQQESYAQGTQEEAGRDSSALSSQELIREAEKLMGELEAVNRETSIGRRASDRVLDAILPKEKEEQCRDNKDA